MIPYVAAATPSPLSVNLRRKEGWQSLILAATALKLTHAVLCDGMQWSLRRRVSVACCAPRSFYMLAVAEAGRTQGG